MINVNAKITKKKLSNTLLITSKVARCRRRQLLSVTHWFDHSASRTSGMYDIVIVRHSSGRWRRWSRLFSVHLMLGRCCMSLRGGHLGVLLDDVVDGYDLRLAGKRNVAGVATAGGSVGQP